MMNPERAKRPRQGDSGLAGKDHLLFQLTTSTRNTLSNRKHGSSKEESENPLALVIVAVLHSILLMTPTTSSLVEDLDDKRQTLNLDHVPLLRVPKPVAGKCICMPSAQPSTGGNFPQVGGSRKSH
eukprot:268474-Amphidinium_carterae.1